MLAPRPQRPQPGKLLGCPLCLTSEPRLWGTRGGNPLLGRAALPLRRPTGAPTLEWRGYGPLTAADFLPWSPAQHGGPGALEPQRLWPSYLQGPHHALAPAILSPLPIRMLPFHWTLTSLWSGRGSAHLGQGQLGSCRTRPPPCLVSEAGGC